MRTIDTLPPLPAQHPRSLSDHAATKLRDRVQAARHELDRIADVNLLDDSLATAAHEEAWWPAGGDPAAPRSRNVATTGRPLVGLDVDEDSGAETIRVGNTAAAEQYRAAVAHLVTADRAIARACELVHRGYVNWEPDLVGVGVPNPDRLATGARRIRRGLQLLEPELAGDISRETAHRVGDAVSAVHDAHEALRRAARRVKPQARHAHLPARPTRPARRNRPA